MGCFMNMVSPQVRIGVVGAGSWGTALANLLAEKGYPIDLWVFEPDICQQIAELRENKTFLPGVTLSENLIPTTDISIAVSNKDVILIVVPSHVVRETANRLKDFIGSETVLVSASKGIENKTHLTMSGVLAESLPTFSFDLFAVLSGPSFAKEVGRHMPTAVTVAAKNDSTADLIQQIFYTPHFRVYTHSDIIGVELGGSVKNVIAIAAGIIDGLDMGLNTRAALITRGMTEIRRLGLKLGANPRTFTGLAGFGDLVLTCTGDLSRNHTIGKQIGQGRKLSDLLEKMQMVAEGVKTAKSVYNLSRKVNVEMPLCHAIYRVLYEELPPKEAVYQLMTRDLKQELDDI
jgi:glycerol-3-phosphate dehydrogenase (NAD(P)+)